MKQETARIPALRPHFRSSHFKPPAAFTAAGSVRILFIGHRPGMNDTIIVHSIIRWSGRQVVTGPKDSSLSQGATMGTRKASVDTSDTDLHRFVVEKNIIGDYSTELEKRFSGELASVKGPVVLDLSATSIIDSRGVALCVGLYKECQQKNLQFSIEVSPELSHFFMLLKLDRILQFTEKGSGK